MAGAFTEARKRQLARLGGAKPLAPRAAIALAKSQAYQDAAEAPGNPASLCNRSRDLRVASRNSVTGCLTKNVTGVQPRQIRSDVWRQAR